MKKIALFLTLLTSLANAQPIFVRSLGNTTCGEALANIQKNKTHKTFYTVYLDGYITQHNWNSNSLLTSTISSITMEQLWIAKCSQVENITKQFIDIANEIIEEEKKKK
jgi:hypothetical protein